MIMLLGVFVIFAAVWNAVGGWDELVATLAEQDSRWQTRHSDLLHAGRYDGGGVDQSPYQFQLAGRTVNPGPYLVVLGWTIVGCGYWTVNHTQTMRLMGARSLWDMRMAAIVGVGVSLPVMIAVACLGVFGRALPEMQDLATPDQLYPQLVGRYLGVGFKGLVVAGVVAAAVSTVDSMGSALSAIFTRDVYARLVNRRRSDHHYVMVSRWTTVCILLLGFLYLPFILLQRNMLNAFTTLIPVFVTPLLTLYLLGVFTPVHRKSGLIGLIAGSGYGVFALYCRESPRIRWLPNADTVPVWLTDRWAAFGWSFLITATTMCIVTCALGRYRPGAAAAVESGWLDDSRQQLPPLREHPFAGAIPWWAQPNLYALILTAVCVYVVFGLFW